MQRIFRNFVVIVASLALGLGFIGLYRDSQGACAGRQRQYDALFTYTRFLAREFHASPAQTAQGLGDLRQTLGARPSC